jgi:hypothetical protein
MRVNLITHVAGRPQSGKGAIPISLTIKPACGLPGDYEYPTDSTTLMQMLRKQTDLPSTVLQRFEGSLTAAPGARLLGVELSNRFLTEIGYFID